MVTTVSEKSVRVRSALAWFYAVVAGLVPGALIVAGVALWSVPGALIVAGALLVLDRYLPDERD